MNEFAKTGTVVGAAVVLTLLALATGPRANRLELFDDEGQEFFPAWNDKLDKDGKVELRAADQVAELEVVEFRESSGAAYPFVVTRDAKGRWTIPSHHCYPADAKDRVGKAGTMLMCLDKEAVGGDAEGPAANRRGAHLARPLRRPRPADGISCQFNRSTCDDMVQALGSSPSLQSDGCRIG